MGGVRWGEGQACGSGVWSVRGGKRTSVEPWDKVILSKYVRTYVCVYIWCKGILPMLLLQRVHESHIFLHTTNICIDRHFPTHECNTHTHTHKPLCTYVHTYACNKELTNNFKLEASRLLGVFSVS